MSAPDWRDVFAEAIRLAERPILEGYAESVLAAIAERGYRLYRDHDYQRVGLASHLKCARCGQRNDGLTPHSSCEGGA